MAIERAFGILSARWRFITKHLYLKSTEDMCLAITAACILHNLCIYMNGDADFNEGRATVANEGRVTAANGEEREGVNEEERGVTSVESVRARRDELNRWFSTQ